MFHVRSNQCIVKWCSSSYSLPVLLLLGVQCLRYIHWITLTYRTYRLHKLMKYWHLCNCNIPFMRICVLVIRSPVSSLSAMSPYLCIFCVQSVFSVCMTLWIWDNVYQTRSMLQQKLFYKNGYYIFGYISQDLIWLMLLLQCSDLIQFFSWSFSLCIFAIVIGVSCLIAGDGNVVCLAFQSLYCIYWYYYYQRVGCMSIRLHHILDA